MNPHQLLGVGNNGVIMFLKGLVPLLSRLEGKTLTRPPSVHFSTSKRHRFPHVEVDGIKLNYKAFGEGEHAVLCLPGLAGTIETDFQKFFEHADRTKFRWISWDPPGCGKSRPPIRDFINWTQERDAHCVAKLMEILGHEKYSVFGWSQGGGTGMFLAAEYPHRVRDLVTLGTNSCNDMEMVRVYQSLTNFQTWSSRRLKQMLTVYSEDYLRQLLNFCLAAVVRSLRSSDGGNYLKDAPEKIQCRVLHINGDRDTLCNQRHAHRLASRTKNSRVLIFPNGGHGLHATHAGDCKDIIEGFFLEENSITTSSHTSKVMAVQ